MDQLKNYYKEMGVDEKVFDYAQEVEKGLKDRFETLDACEDPKLLKPYLYASYKYMSMEEYHILLTKNDTYAEINTELRSEMKEIREGIQMEMSEQLTDKWKQQYRRSHI